MAQKLSVTIALEGGKEIEKQLADIGEAGKKAFADIGDEADKAGTGFKGIKTEEVTAKLKQLGITGAAEIQKIQDAVKQAGRLESLVQGISNVETAFSALAANAVPIIGTIVAGFVKATQLALAWADAVNKVSTEAMKLGVPIEQLDKLRQGFERAGISSEAISDGLRKVKAGLDELDVARVKQAFEQLQEAATRGIGGIGSAPLKSLQTAAEGTGKAADDARVAFAKLADAQALKSLQSDMDSAALAAERARAALAKVSQVPVGTPGRAEELRRLQAGFENATIAADRAKAAVAAFTPSPAPLTGFAAALDKLGIAGGKLGDVIPQIIEKFRAMPDSAQRTALAIQTLGDKMGPELVAALQTGSAGIDMFTQKWAGLTEAQAVEAAKTQQTLNQLSAEWDRFKAALVAPVAMPMLAFLRSELEAIQGHINSTVNEFYRIGQAIATMSADPIANTVRELTALGAAVVGATGAVGDFIARIGSITWDAISGAGVAAWNKITGAIQSAYDALLKFIGLGPAAAPGGATSAPGKASGGLIGGRGTGTSDSNLAWLSRGEFVMPAWAVSQPGVLQLLEALRRNGGIPGFAEGGLVGGIRQMVIETGKAIGQMTFAVIDPMRGVMDQINNTMESFSSAAQSLINSLRGVDDKLFDLEKKLEGRASGGLIGDRGTGTSDSNLAWVSRGEHIMPARAVSQPGVLAFLEALRRSGGDLTRVLDGMGRFATGGLVAMPTLASSGLGGMSHVTIQFPGMPAVTGLRASAEVVDELRRSAAMAQVRSGGRKPSRYT